MDRFYKILATFLLLSCSIQACKPSSTEANQVQSGEHKSEAEFPVIDFSVKTGYFIIAWGCNKSTVNQNLQYHPSSQFNPYTVFEESSFTSSFSRLMLDTIAGIKDNKVDIEINPQSFSSCQGKVRYASLQNMISAIAHTIENKPPEGLIEEVSNIFDTKKNEIYSSLISKLPKDMESINLLASKLAILLTLVDIPINEINLPTQTKNIILSSLVLLKNSNPIFFPQYEFKTLDSDIVKKAVQNAFERLNSNYYALEAWPIDAVFSQNVATPLYNDTHSFNQQNLGGTIQISVLDTPTWGPEINGSIELIANKRQLGEEAFNKLLALRQKSDQMARLETIQTRIRNQLDLGNPEFRKELQRTIDHTLAEASYTIWGRSVPCPIEDKKITLKPISLIQHDKEAEAITFHFDTRGLSRRIKVKVTIPQGSRLNTNEQKSKQTLEGYLPILAACSGTEGGLRLKRKSMIKATTP
ncbi:MAG: hypothetical protein R3B45_02535 [Bdellovibrionota bacterium]